MDLLLDQIKVVEQPICRVRYSAAWIHGQRFAIEEFENLGVVVEALQQAVCSALGGDPMAAGNRLGMRNELIEAE